MDFKFGMWRVMVVHILESQLFRRLTSQFQTKKEFIETSQTLQVIEIIPYVSTGWDGKKPQTYIPETQQKASQGEIAVADAVVVVVAAAAAVAAAVEAWLAALYFAVSGVAEIEFAAAAAPSHTFWQTHSLCFCCPKSPTPDSSES
jgi:hypothetical protein